MMETLLAAFARLGHWGYLLFFLLPFLESAAFTGLLIPGETAAILAGLLSSQGYLDLGNCLLVISLGAILGDTTGYAFGKTIGRGYFARHKRILFLTARHVKRTGDYFTRHGGKVIFLARFTHLLRAMAPFVAGMSRMPYKKFLIFNITGGLTWTVCFTLLGYFFGQSWQLIDKWAGRAGVFILFMAVVIAGFIYLSGKAVRRKTEIFAWFNEMSGTIAALPALRNFRDRHPAFVAFVRERLSPEGYLGLHLTVGLMVSAVFVWIFGGITEDVLTGDPLVAVDHWILSKVHYFQSPVTTVFMTTCTSLGGSKMISAGTLIVLVYLAFTKRFDNLITYLVSMIGGSLLVIVLKTVVHRLRPHAGSSLIQIGGWSFPSGHAMMSIIFYGMLAYLLVRNMQSWRLKVLTVAAASFIIFVIGLSRLYLEAHYLSDVLAGYVGGLFWLTIAITGIEVYKKMHLLPETKEPD